MIFRKLFINGLAFVVLGNVATLAESSGTMHLTFDDGPVNATLDVLDVLKDKNTKATFFINAFHLIGLGDENESRAIEALTRILQEGHVLANHSQDHMLRIVVNVKNVVPKFIMKLIVGISTHIKM